MNSTKLFSMGTLLGAMLALAACQSTAPVEHSKAHHHHLHRMQDRTPEQHAVWQAKREQRMKHREQLRKQHQARKSQFEHACQGKRVGEQVVLQLNNRRIKGSCEVRFTPDAAQLKR